MRAPTARWIAGGIAAGSVGLMAAGLILAYADRHVLPAHLTTWDFSDVSGAVSNLALPVTGFVVASRRPRNRIGWLALAAGLALALGTFGPAYGARALIVAPGSLPAGRAVMWVANSIWVVPAAAAVFLFLLFPTGQLRSRRWRPAAWFVSGVFALIMVSAVVGATRVWSHPFMSFNQAQGGPVLSLELLLVPIAFLVSVAAATVRFALASGEERLQLKWFAAAALLVLVTVIPSILTNSAVATVLANLAFLCLNASIVVAVLKYRLYEIDIVISKAVLYGSLAVVITAVYVALVVGVGTAVGNQHSVLLSALAAAVVAVAFQPLRQRAGPAGEPGGVRPAGHPVPGAVRVRPAHRQRLRRRGRAAADGADRGGRDRGRAGRGVAAGGGRAAPRGFVRATARLPFRCPSTGRRCRRCPART